MTGRPGVAVPGPAAVAQAPPDPRRWRALIFIALAQLIVSLDVTVVSIALPSAQSDLGMSDTSRQWIIAAYTLAFGSLLLFGGRVADLIGRRRTLLLGLTGFAVASAVGGAATSGVVLIAARAAQGACGALLSPAALALVSTTFREPAERARAFGVYNAVASGGLAIGLVVGGTVTEYLDWRWAFYISVPCAIAAAAGALALVREPVRAGRGRLDVPGALLATTGLVVLVVALAGAENGGWTSGPALASFAAAAALLAAFALVERRASQPLLPPRVILNRDRAGVYLGLICVIIGMFGLFLFLTYYLQVVKGYSPVVTGLAFLPLVIASVAGSTQVAGRLPGVPPRTLLAGGFLAAAAGTFLLTGLRVGGGYATGVLPAEILAGLGMGTVFVPASNLSTLGVRAGDSGVASAVFVTVQQVGASIGTVLLNSIAAGATARYAATHRVGAGAPAASRVLRLESMVHGFVSATWWAAGILLLGALVSVVFVGRGAALPPAVATAGRPEPVPENLAG